MDKLEKVVLMYRVHEEITKALNGGWLLDYFDVLRAVDRAFEDAE